MNLLIAQPQPEFPKQDVNEGNAELLRLLLTDSYGVGRLHDTVEYNSSLLRMGHSTSVRLAGALDTGALPVVEMGVVHFEAIGAYLNNTKVWGVGQKAIQLTILHMVEAANDGDARDYAIELTEQFQEEMPRTTELILGVADTSRRNYAVLGAAMARSFELQATELDAFEKLMSGFEE